MALQPVVRPMLGRDQVYKYLREAILRGELKPNQKLIESSYTKMFKVSRTPIREAFRMLEKDGLVQYVAQKGIYVRGPMSESEIREVFFIRRALQMATIDDTIDNATQEDIDFMHRCNEEAQRAIGCEDLQQFVSCNNRFNHRLIQSSRLEMVAKLLTQMERYNPVFSFIEESTYMPQKGRCVKAVQEHIDILDSIIKRDRERYRAVLDIHILNTRDAFLNTLG